jgi:hypothetical protein
MSIHALYYNLCINAACDGMFFNTQTCTINYAFPLVVSEVIVNFIINYKFLPLPFIFAKFKEKMNSWHESKNILSS